MSYPVIRYNELNAAGTAFVNRGRSAQLWGGSLDKYAVSDPDINGILFFDDFMLPRSNVSTTGASEAGWWMEDAAAGGTNESFASIAAVDGTATASATTGTDWFGIEIHRGVLATDLGTVVLPTHPTLGRGKVVYETRVTLSGSDHYFIGLGEPGATFLGATGALPTDRDYIGFFRNDAGGLSFVAANDNNGGTAVTYSATLLSAANTTALAAGFHKLGFAVNADNSVDIFVDGEQIFKDTSGNSIVVTTTALSIEFLTQVYTSLRGATGDLATVSLPIDWVGTWVENG